MSGPFDNSLDAVGSRDHLAEYVFCCSQAMVGLSRLAEELVLWSTVEFGRVRFGDVVTTGSSALPQKRNPDIAELVRERAARVERNLVAMLTLQKGLPLSYNRDLQEDKRLLFDSDDVLAASLEAMAALLGEAEFTPGAIGPEVAALDLAESLVVRGVPFREAHHTVGKLLLALEADGRSLGEATVDDLVDAHSKFLPVDLDLLDPGVSVARRSSRGSGSADSVRQQAAELRRRLAAAVG
jgi:argininosuccinate lyase